jgi:hypothetical protein
LKNKIQKGAKQANQSEDIGRMEGSKDDKRRASDEEEDAPGTDQSYNKENTFLIVAIL